MAISFARRETIVAGLVAGIVAAIALDAFLLIVHWPGIEYLDPTAFYTFAATVLAGSVAEGASWAVVAGVAMHVFVAILWAFGYLYLARSQPQLVRRPVISGLAFGFVVYFMMLALLVPAGKYVQPTIHVFDRDIIAYTIFFGLPLALVAARLAPVPK